MPASDRIGEIEIQQDLEHQALVWRLERLGWLLGALALLAALLGLTGSGFLSDATSGEKGSSLWIEYQRFERYQSPANLRVYVGPENVEGGQVRLWFNRTFIDRVQLRHIDPAPERVEAESKRIAYVFNVSEAGQHPIKIELYFEPNSFGKTRGEVSVEKRSPIAFTQFSYP
jgi:hypothetical protein